MSTSIIASYTDAISVSFNSEAWFNATSVANHFGKRPNDWLNLDSTKEYIAELSAFFNYQESSLLKTKAGRHGGGTWFHPKLAVAFARWLDVRFAIWCDMQIEKILHSQTPNVLKSLEPPTIAPHQQHALQVIVARKSGAVGAIRAMLWSRFNNHFRLGSYKQLPAEKFDEAVAYLEGIQTAHDPARVPGLDKVYSYPRNLLEQPTFRGMNGEAPAVLNLGMVTHDDFRSPLADLLREMAADGHTVDGAMAEYVTLRESLVHAGQALRHVMSAAWDALGAPCSPTGQLH